MSSQTRICMIGGGRVGRLHSGTVQRFVPEADVAALVDPVAAVAEKTGQEFGIEHRLASLEEALDKVDFEAVIITTPTYSHRDLAVMAASSKKTIYYKTFEKRFPLSAGFKNKVHESR